MSFAYGDKQHAVCVLIDHGRGGKIRDSSVTKGTNCVPIPSGRSAVTRWWCSR